MQLVALQFLSIQDLWRFRLEINAYIFEVNFRNKVIICDCTAEHIELAKNKYRASIVEARLGKA